MRGVLTCASSARGPKRQCGYSVLYIPTKTLKLLKGCLDGQTPKSPNNGSRVHPGPPGETTGARAPSYARGVQRDRAGGEPPSRAIGGQIHRTDLSHLKGGLNLLKLTLVCFVLGSVDCRSTYAIQNI